MVVSNPDEGGNIVVSIKACRHEFHKACLQQWSNRKSTCPKCRVSMLNPPQPVRMERVEEEEVNQSEGASNLAMIPANSWFEYSLFQTEDLLHKRPPMQFAWLSAHVFRPYLDFIIAFAWLHYFTHSHFSALRITEVLDCGVARLTVLTKRAVLKVLSMVGCFFEISFELEFFHFPPVLFCELVGQSDIRYQHIVAVFSPPVYCDVFDSGQLLMRVQIHVFLLIALCLY